MVAIAGPDGAGKSMLYESQLRYMGLPFINADAIAAESRVDAYEAGAIADQYLRELVGRFDSFVFEAVFSDPVTEKVIFLQDASAAGYSVVLMFVGISSAEVSVDRVGQRMAKGGQGVPREELAARYPRVMDNLRRAMLFLPLVLVYDNDDLREPYRFCAAAGMGKVLEVSEPVPEWVRSVLPK